MVTLAACDKDVDQWIKEMSGAGIRKFLADVGGFEKLGIGELSRLARKTARRRRRELEKALKEKEAGEGQNDGVIEAGGSSGSSTVREWKPFDIRQARPEDTNKDRKMGFVADDEPVYHISEPETGIRRNRDQRRHMGDETENEHCDCNEERRVDKGKGKEMEEQPQNHEHVRSRRDRFGFRGGHVN